MVTTGQNTIQGHSRSPIWYLWKVHIPVPIDEIDRRVFWIATIHAFDRQTHWPATARVCAALHTSPRLKAKWRPTCTVYQWVSGAYLPHDTLNPSLPGLLCRISALSSHEPDHADYRIHASIKLCPREAQTWHCHRFFDRDLEINTMTLKPEGELDIPKMYLHTENEAASLRHSKLRAWIGKNMKILSQG